MTGKPLTRAVPWLLAIAAIAAVALSGNKYIATVGILIAVNAIAASGLSLFVSYAGQFSLGHAALMGVGAYGAAIAAKDLDLPPLLSLVVGVALAALIGLLIGLPTVRLAGYYLAIATYGLGVIVYVAFQEGGALTGGAQGLSGIPPLILFGINLSANVIGYFITLGIVLLGCVLLISTLVSSNYGRGLRTLSRSEASAEAMGVAVTRVKLQVFVLSAAMAGLAGGLYAYAIRYLDPGAFSPAVSISLLIMIALGGVRSLWGPVIGTILFVGLREILKAVLPAVAPQAGTRVEMFFFGIVLILVLLYPPNTLWAALKRRIVRSVPADSGSLGTSTSLS